MTEDLSEVTTVTAMVSRDEFLQEFYYRNRPLRLRNLAGHWPALRRWTREHLTHACGHLRVEVMMNRNSTPGHKQYSLRDEVRFSEFIDLVYSGRVTNDYYAMLRHGYFANPEAVRLLSDIDPPPYVQVQEPMNDVLILLGPAGTVPPLHHDQRNALLVQISGVKRVRMYAPQYSERMLQRVPFYAHTPSPVKIDADGATLDMRPGDALFIPVGWWHSVVALDISLSVSLSNFGVLNESGPM